ncbi:MAG: hypothetical protein K2K91_02135 [Ruminococcus sp.]|nr:hypothetical protein [Ruminococcus sp.]
MTFEEYRKEMRKLGWSEKRINDKIEMFERLTNLHPACKKILKLEDYLEEPPVVYSSEFTDETMKKHWKE